MIQVTSGACPSNTVWQRQQFCWCRFRIKESIRNNWSVKCERCFCAKKIYFKWTFHPPVITRDRVFTDEALYTFICKTECIINKILLSVISDHVNDFDTLTSNHSLVVEAILTSHQENSVVKWYTPFYISKIFISNARLKLAKNQADAKQHSEAELWLFENYSHSSSTLSSKKREHTL